MSVRLEIEEPDRGVRRAEAVDLAAHPDNPRAGLGDLTELVQSMRSVGLVQPVVVTTREAHLAAHPEHETAIGGARYVIIAGHRRAAAAAAAQIREVPIEIRPELSRDGLDIEVMAVENLQRQDLNPIEEAELYRKLAGMGRSQRQIARRVGRAQSHVSKRLALLDLPPHVQERVAAGQLEITEALALAPGTPRRPQHRRDGQTTSSDRPAPDRSPSAELSELGSPARERPELRDRDWCCARLAARVPTTSSALRRLADAVLQLAPSGEALALAHRWLRRADVGPEIDDPVEYARVAAGAGHRLRMQIAHAVVLAADELRLRRAQRWGVSEGAHVRRLMDEVGYLPSGMERRMLAEQEAVIPAESAGMAEPLALPADSRGISRGAA